MTTISVSVSGKPLFVWEGGDDDLTKSEADLRLRFGKGQPDPDFPTFDDLVENVVRQIAESGRFTTNNAEVEMRFVVSFLLSQSTGDPQRPSSFRDYVLVWDFSFDMTPKPTGLDINTRGNFERMTVQ